MKNIFHNALNKNQMNNKTKTKKYPLSIRNWPKDDRPREKLLKYGISNLFRVELPKFWRMLYTLTNGENEIEIIAFILDVLDHKRYDKKFGYKGK